MDRNAPPVVLPAKPAPPLIAIPEAKPGEVGTSRAENPETYWKAYYQSHDEEPEAVREKVRVLNRVRKFRDVRAILVGYLTAHSDRAEPWMYEALALATKMNGGKEKAVRDSLGFAADLAVRSRNPNHLVSVADLMLVMNELDRAGDLLDRAADLVPQRGEPLLMSVDLAQRQKDPKRMGDSLDKLLALGWPGVDETVRRDARKQADQLAKSLREQGRADEADALLERLNAAEARDLFVRLTWVGDADLELVIEEPLGATAKYLTPRTVFGGALVKNGYGTHPEEVYVCPRGFNGVYTIKVETSYNNPAKPAVQAKLEVITHEGTPEEHKEVHTVTLGKAVEPIKISLTDGRRKTAMPYISANALAAPLLDRQAAQGKGRKPRVAGGAGAQGKGAGAAAPPR